MTEQLNDAVRQASELTERWNDWLAMEKRGFAERYLCGHVKIAIRRTDVGKPCYGAIFEPRPKRRVDLDESLVLSSDVHLVDGAEQIIPSLVRFQRFEDEPTTVSEPLFSFGFSRRIDGTRVVIGSRRFAPARSAEKEFGPELEWLLPHLRVRLLNQQVWGDVDPGFESLLEGWEVGYGPVNGPESRAHKPRLDASLAP
jgi:hypothetical protein